MRHVLKACALFIATLVVFSLSISVASAACTTPAGNAGDVVFSSLSGQMAYCNGVNWIGMGLSQPVSFGTLNNGYFCTATSGTAIACNTQFVSLSSQVSGTLQAAQFPALTGDVTTTAGSLATAIGANKVTMGDIATIAGLSVIGNGSSSTGNVGAITGTANQTLIVNNAGTGLAFGALNLASSAAVTGLLTGASGGTGVNNGANTITLGGNLATSGAFATTLTMTGATSVTLPTSGTLLSTTSTIGTSQITGILAPLNGGTGVANANTNTITLGSSLATSGAFPLTLTTTASTNVTLPTTGTLVNTAVTTLSSLASIGTITTGVWNGTAIGPTFGGTGQTTYNKGDTLYASATNTLSALPIGTSGYILTVASGVPTWAAAAATGVTSFNAGTTGFTPATATTGAVTLSGVLNVANGGTGLNSLTSNVIYKGNGTGNMVASSLTDNGTVYTSENVGIGTTGPSALLQISGNLPSSGTLKSSSFLVSNGAMTATSGNDYPLGALSTTEINTMYLSTRAHQNVTGSGWSNVALGLSYDVDGSIGVGGQVWFYNGDVGIGTTAPLTTLDVEPAAGAPATSGNVNSGIVIAQSGGSGPSLNMGNYNASSVYYSWIQSAFHNNASVTEPLALQPVGGNVGIGTASPTDFLNIYGALAGSGLTLKSTSGAGVVLNRAAAANSADINFETAGTTDFFVGTGIYNSNSNLNIGNGSSIFVTVGTTGLVGIGTTAPGYAVDVYGNASGANMGFRTKNTSSGGYVTYDLVNDGGNSGALFFTGSGVTGYGGANSLNVVNVSNNPLAFGVNNSINMTIATGGNVGIGTTSPQEKFTVVNGADGWAADFFGAAGGNQVLLGTLSGGAVVGANNGAGTAWATLDLYGSTVTTHNVSDERLKTGIADLPAQNGLAAIAQLHPVIFHWKDAELDRSKGQQIGLIAQEVQTVFPKLVETLPSTTITLGDGTKQTIPKIRTLNYEGLIVPILKAVQELETLFDADHVEVANIKADNDNLRVELSTAKAANENEAAQIKALTLRLDALEAARH